MTDIRAAGGLVWRRREGGGTKDIEIAVVHRPRYDDWSLPKGKLDAREEPLLAAVREVGEETGRAVVVERSLAVVRYDVGNREKAVRYWAMRDAGPLGDGHIADTDEVSALDWLTPGVAAERLTYPDDRRVLDTFRRRPQTGGVLVLVRHARAGRRADWDGEDALRPLDDRGRAQARALVPLLAAFGPTALAAADRTRCEQTLAPLGEHLGLPVTSLPQLSDEAFTASSDDALQALVDAAATSPVTVVCSQGGAIPGVLEDWLPPRVRTTVRSLETRKAAWWVLGVNAGLPVWVDRYDRPTLPS